MKLVSKMINLNVSIKKSIPGNGFTGTPAQNGEWLTFKEGMCVLTESQAKRLVDIGGETKTLGDWIRSLRGFGTDFIEVPEEAVVAPRSSEPDHFTMSTDNGRLGESGSHRNDNSIYNKATLAEMVKAEATKIANEQIKAMMPNLIEIVKNQLTSGTTSQDVSPVKIQIPEPIKPINSTDELEVEEEEDKTLEDMISENDDTEQEVLEMDGEYFFNGKPYKTESQAKSAKRLIEANKERARTRAKAK